MRVWSLKPLQLTDGKALIWNDLATPITGSFLAVAFWR
jgi:hypothetical protein